MFTALNLIIRPGRAWEGIANSQHSALRVFLISWLPWMLIATCAEGYALLHWGNMGEFRHVNLVSLPDVKVYLQAQWFGAGLVLLFGTTLARAAGAGLHQRFTFTQCFTLVAYAMAPLFLGRLLDCIPALNTWLCWGLGAGAMLVCLYEGVGMVMRPEITKGFGLYMILFLSLLLLSGLSHFFAVSALQRGRLF